MRDCDGEAGHSRRVEDRTNLDFHTEDGTDPRHRLHGPQRMSTKLKEIIVDADSVASQQPGPYPAMVCSTAVRGAT